MGAWGVGTFDNDEALDWAADLEESAGIDLLLEALDVDDEGYLEAPSATEILCAAEVIAALEGRPGSELPEGLAEWVAQTRGLDLGSLVPKAIAKLDQVLGTESELNELWAENEEEYPVWKAQVLDLRGRLVQVGR